MKKVVVISGAIGVGKSETLRSMRGTLIDVVGEIAVLESDQFYMMIDPHWTCPPDRIERYYEVSGRLLQQTCSPLTWDFLVHASPAVQAVDDHVIPQGYGRGLHMNDVRRERGLRGDEGCRDPASTVYGYPPLSENRCVPPMCETPLVRALSIPAHHTAYVRMGFPYRTPAISANLITECAERGSDVRRGHRGSRDR